MNIASMIITYS